MSVQYAILAEMHQEFSEDKSVHKSVACAHSFVYCSLSLPRMVEHTYTVKSLISFNFFVSILGRRDVQSLLVLIHATLTLPYNTLHHKTT